MFFSNEINRLISKGMSNIFHWEKLTFSKLARKVNFLERKFEKFHYLWRATRYKVYSRKCLFWHCLQLSFAYKTLSQISFNLFCSGDNRFLSELLRKSGWLQGHNEHFPNILANTHQNFKKLRQGFVDESALITTTLISSCHWKTLAPFCLQKKRLENTFLTLTVNYCKIVHENKLCHPKQQ